jgi:all-trans-retinol 13,14-reductase
MRAPPDPSATPRAGRPEPQASRGDTSFDAVVIGAGAGGLTTACILAKEGRKVLVLEKHTRVGGYLQRFYREKTPFDTGFHYLGKVGPNGALRRYWDYLGIAGELSFHELDPEGFDRLRFPDFELALPKGRDAYRERLEERFPEEREAVTRYTDEVARACAAFPLYTLEGDPSGPEARAAMASPRTLANLLDDVKASEGLRQVLTGQTFLHGSPPSRVPLWVHALVTDSYVSEGAFGLDGGGDSLARVLARRIRSLGGDVRQGCGARRILVDEREVRGVELTTGERVETRTVVAAIHPRRVLELLPEGAMPPALVRRVQGFEESVATLGLYFRLDRRLIASGAWNVYWYRTTDTETVFRDRTDDPRSPRFLFLTWPSVRDRHWRYPENMIALAPAQSDEIARFRDSCAGARPEEYERWKERAAAPIVETLEREVEGFAGNARLVSVSTPLTQEGYTGSHLGSNYGVLQSAEQQGLYRLSPRTRVHGLYLTGQSIGLMGVLGVTVTAFRTAGEIVGLGPLFERVRGGL